MVSNLVIESNAFLRAPRKKKLFTLMALYVGFVASILTSATQSTMLPVAAMEIGGAEYYTLVSSLAGTVGVILLPLYGFLSAKYPSIKGKLMGVSLLINALVFVSRVFVKDMWQIIIPGMLYGMIAPTIYVLGYSYIRDLYDAKKAAYYLGFSATMVSIGQLVGPALGGVIIDAGGWRLVNHIIWPLFLISGFFALIGVNVKAEDVRELARDVGFDFWGAISLILCLGSITLALSLVSTFAPLGSSLSNILLVIFIVSLVSFVLSVMKMKDSAFLPLGVLKDRNTLALTGAQLFVNLHTMSTIVFLPLAVLRLMGQNATMASLTTSMYAVAGLAMGPIFGKWIAKHGTVKPLHIASTILRIVITVYYAIAVSPTTSIYIILFMQLISGFYNSANSVVFSVGPQVMLKEAVRVQGNSVIQTVQTLGSTLAIAIYTMIIGVYGLDGINIIFWVAAVFAVLNLFATLFVKKESEQEMSRVVANEK